MNTQKTSLRALTLIARILGKKRGVEVVFDPTATTASTNSKVITLPVFSDVGNESQAMLINGLVDHEAAHCRFTDFTVFSGSDRILQSLLNIVEDVWIEREQAKIYPGCWINIVDSMRVMIARDMFGSPDKESAKSAPCILVNGVLHCMLARHYGDDLPMMGSFGKAWEKAITGLIGKQECEKLLQITHEVDGVHSTSQAMAVAQKLIAFLDQRDVQEKMGGPSSSYVLNPDLVTARGQLISAQLTMHGDAGHSVALHGVCRELANDVPGEEQLKAEKMSRGIASRLGGKLDEAIRAKIDDLVSYGRTGNRLSARRLPGLATGNTSVFQTIDEVEGINATVTVVLVVSGSMFRGDQPIVQGLACLIALFDVLETYEIPTALVLFGTHFCVAKPFGKSWKSTKRAKLDEGYGGTNTAPALCTATNLVIDRSESKNLILLITDGDSGNSQAVDAVLQEVAVSMPRVAMSSVVIAKRDSLAGDIQQLYEARKLPVSRVEPSGDLALAIYQALKEVA